jgi:hypothetical protein
MDRHCLHRAIFGLNHKVDYEKAHWPRSCLEQTARLNRSQWDRKIYFTKWSEGAKKMPAVDFDRNEWGPKRGCHRSETAGKDSLSTNYRTCKTLARYITKAAVRFSLTQQTSAAQASQGNRGQEARAWRARERQCRRLESMAESHRRRPTEACLQPILR